MWPTTSINDLSSVCKIGQNWFRCTLITNIARRIFGSPRKSITKFICELDLPHLSTRQILNATEPCQHQVRNVQGLRLVPSFFEMKKLEPKTHTLDTFSDEAIVLTRDHLNEHSCVCWVLKNLYRSVLRQHKRDSPKIWMWCAVTILKNIYFFYDDTISGPRFFEVLSSTRMDNLHKASGVLGHFNWTVFYSTLFVRFYPSGQVSLSPN
jgi:hypothetical protein